MISDMHVHTSFSCDSKVDIEDQINQAIKLGMEHLAITDHQDFDYPPWHSTYLLEDTDAYVDKILQLKDKYKNKIDLILGIELGMQPHIAQKLDDYAAQYPFEFIIGSTHCFSGRDTEDQTLYENRPKEEAIEEYFQTEYDNIKRTKCFDIVGHLDFVLRDIPNKNEGFLYSTYADVLDAMLKEIIQSGRGIECNTKSLFVGMGEPSPDSCIIKRYRELGGEIITFGSDAHNFDRVGCSFELAAEFVRNCGFTHYAVFNNHKPIFLPL